MRDFAASASLRPLPAGAAGFADAKPSLDCLSAGEIDALWGLDEEGDLRGGIVVYRIQRVEVSPETGVCWELVWRQAN